MDQRKPGPYDYDGFMFDYEPFYVGKGHGSRCFVHLGCLKYEGGTFTHKSNKIRKIYRETGKEPVIIKYLNGVTESEAFNLEFDMIKTIGRLFEGGPLLNLREGGTGGGLLAPESRKKISESQKGNKYRVGTKNSPETVQKIKDSLTGRKHTLETCQKISKSLLGNTNTRGYRHSAETCQKVSEGKKGHKHSEETKEKLRKAMVGKEFSEETRVKMSKAKKGKSHNHGKALSIGRSNAFLRLVVEKYGIDNITYENYTELARTIGKPISRLSTIAKLHFNSNTEILRKNFKSVLETI